LCLNFNRADFDGQSWQKKDSVDPLQQEMHCIQLIGHSISANMTCWTWLGSVIECSNMMMCILFSFCNMLFVKELHEHTFQDWICNINVHCEGTREITGLAKPITTTERNITSG